MYCGSVIVGRSVRAKYCSNTHREEASRKRKIYAETEVTHGRSEKLTSQRRQSLPMYHQIAGGRGTLEELAVALGVSVSKVTKDYTAWRKAVNEEVQLGDWERSDETKWMLGADLEMPDFTDLEGCAVWAVAMTERFMAFEEEFFKLASGKSFLRDEFHYVWITSVLASIASGGYLQILSPPRHGKSELLVHFCVWLISWNSNIRILWVGPSEPIASQMLVAVKTYLEDSTDLIDAVVGPAGSFQPTSSHGRDWSATSFTVMTRTVTLVGSTMLAVGRGAKILSRNADFIVADDIEDKNSTAQPKLRQDTKDWFGTDLDSRKEEHSALVVIGSRQHLDDLYASNLEDENFFNIVNAAHDPDCHLDPYNEKLHSECMLFPGLRTYRWLMTKKRGAIARGNPNLFEMVYQNNPQGEGVMVFDKQSVEASRNPSRVVGLSGIPSGFQLIAGLDPSATGYQAGFLWAVREHRMEGFGQPDLAPLVQMERWMVDLNNQIGGGVAKAQALMEDWLLRYGCRIWVVEQNAFQKAILEDRVLVGWAKANNVMLIPHTTGMNKADPLYGVGAMSRLFLANLVDLPYGDDESRVKTRSYVKQVLEFTEDSVKQKKNTSDILMASWFPTAEIAKWETMIQQLQSPPTRPSQVGYKRSFTKLASFSDSERAPWRLP